MTMKNTTTKTLSFNCTFGWISQQNSYLNKHSKPIAQIAWVITKILTDFATNEYSSLFSVQRSHVFDNIPFIKLAADCVG